MPDRSLRYLFLALMAGCFVLAAHCVRHGWSFVGLCFAAAGGIASVFAVVEGER